MAPRFRGLPEDTGAFSNEPEAHNDRHGFVATTDRYDRVVREPA